MKIEYYDCPKCGGNIPVEVIKGQLFKCAHCDSTLVWPENTPNVILSFGTKLCPSCGRDNEQTREFCRQCGTSIEKTCPLCKVKFYVGDNYCPNGHNFDKEYNEYYQKANAEKTKFPLIIFSSTLTLILTLLFGCPGIFLCVFGIWGATGTMPYTTEIGGITGGGTMPSTVGFVLLCLSLIFIAIPIVVGFMTLRKKPAPATPPGPAEPLPPPS